MYDNQGVVSERTGESAMVRDKDEVVSAVAAWDRKAAAEGFRCVVCSSKITYGDREEFFRTKMCGRCAQQATKDNWSE